MCLEGNANRFVRADLVEELPVVLDFEAEGVAVVDLEPVEVLVLERTEGALADAVLAGALAAGADVDQLGPPLDVGGEADRLGESGSAAGRMALIGLTVLESNLAGHARCLACPMADSGLAAWRRAALHSSARAFQRRLHLPGRPGLWMGAAIAIARRPRLAPAALAMLSRGRSASTSP